MSEPDEAAVEAVARSINWADNEWADAPRTMPHEVWPVHVARAVLATPIVDGWRRDDETLAKVRLWVDNHRSSAFGFSVDAKREAAEALVDEIADLLAGES